MLLETRQSILVQHRIFRDSTNEKIIIQKIEISCQFKNRNANKQLINTVPSHCG